MDFDPATSLIRVLGPSPKEPWEALIPQILVWCFRRFCIQKLISSEGTLQDSLWEDHIELVQRYCPRGLENASLEWMTPENIQTVSSPLSQYNEFFLEFSRNLDSYIEKEDYSRQDTMSEFLDSTICTIFSDWLKDSPFSIFPMDILHDDDFTDSQFRLLINSLLAHVKNNSSKPKEVVSEELPAKDVVPEESPPQPLSLLWQLISIPPMIPEFLIARQPVNNPIVTPPNIQVQQEPVQQPLQQPESKHYPTVARALAYRRTIRRSGRFKHAKTRRSHPAL